MASICFCRRADRLPRSVGVVSLRVNSTCASAGRARVRSCGRVRGVRNPGPSRRSLSGAGGGGRSSEELIVRLSGGEGGDNLFAARGFVGPVGWWCVCAERVAFPAEAVGAAGGFATGVAAEFFLCDA